MLARLARQVALEDETKQFYLMMGEAALHRRLVPPAAMHVQLENLIRISRLRNVTVSVIPFDTDQ